MCEGRRCLTKIDLLTILFPRLQIQNYFGLPFFSFPPFYVVLLHLAQDFLSKFFIAQHTLMNRLKRFHQNSEIPHLHQTSGPIPRWPATQYWLKLLLGKGSHLITLFWLIVVLKRFHVKDYTDIVSTRQWLRRHLARVVNNYANIVSVFSYFFQSSFFSVLHIVLMKWYCLLYINKKRSFVYETSWIKRTNELEISDYPLTETRTGQHLQLLTSSQQPSFPFGGGSSFP